jgi:hypothetical protein
MLFLGPDLNNGTASGYLTELNNDTICENSVVLLPYKIPLESKILFLQECGSHGIIVSSLGGTNSRFQIRKYSFNMLL